MRRSLRGVAAALAQERLAERADFPGFPPVEAEEIAQELDLYVRAAEAGQRGEPARNAQAPDPIEAAIGDGIDERAQAGTRAYRAHLAQHDAEIRHTFLTDADDLEIEASCRTLLAELDARIRDSQARLMEFWRDEVQEVEAEFQEFRERNGLERPPRLVSNGEKLLRVVALVCLGALGVFAHGKLFGSGGLDVGKLVLGVLWSIVNVGAAVWYAREGLPRLVGRGFGSKLLGVTTGAVFLGCTVAVNVLAAHHLELWLVHSSQPTLKALWAQITSGPFALEASRAWLLAGLGVAGSTVAVFAAAGMDDLYPGYGAIGRRRVAALATYEIEAASCSERLTSLQDAAEEDLRATIEAVQGRERESSVAIEARGGFHLEFLEFLDQLAAAQEHLCRRYRQINAAVQNGAVPAYFALDIERLACLIDPGLAAPPQPRQAWHQPIERLQQHAQSVAALFAESRPRQPAPVEIPRPDPVEEGIEVGV